MFIGNSQSIFVWRVFCLRGRWQSVNNHLPPPLPLWWLPSGRDRPKTMCFLFLSFSSSFYGRLSKRGDGRMAWNLVAAEERGGRTIGFCGAAARQKTSPAECRQSLFLLLLLLLLLPATLPPRAEWRKKEGAGGGLKVWIASFFSFLFQVSHTAQAG